MTAGLARALLEAHLGSGPTRARPLPGGKPIALRCDHMLTDADSATLVFQCFESAGRPQVAGDVTLVCDEAAAPPPRFERRDELAYVQSAARRYGAWFSRAGNGRAHQVHAARFAAPGRLLLTTCADAAAAAGALGMLGFATDAVELASVLAGVPLPADAPPVWAVQLLGALPPWADPQDVVLSLARTLAGAGAHGAVLEYGGPGVAQLSQSARFTIARGGAGLAARASLFPSDEVTRAWLAAQGREPDWKILSGGSGAAAARVIGLHLDGVEPLIAREEEGAEPLEVREAAGIPVARVVLGADATLEDLLRVAETVGPRPLAPGVELEVVPGSRQIREAAAGAGALTGLVAAGARVLDSEVRLARAPREGAVLRCGARPATGERGASFRVGAVVAAAAALCGRIADPREHAPSPVTLPRPARFPADETRLVRPAVEPGAVEVVRGEAVRPVPVLPPLVATQRGVVLLRLGDRVGAAQAFPCGPRVWRHRADPGALATHLFSRHDPGFPARARAYGGGFIVAGADYGAGPRGIHAALALVALRVRIVFARSFAPGHRLELVQVGVLPLRFASADDAGALALGDELEIPGLPEGLERNKPVVVRDLNRGTQLAVHHDLDEREIEMVRAGGMLALQARGPDRP